MERVDAVVVGAGVVGLAIARALALAGRDVLVLEAEAAIGTGVSARNSEVIHAGLYYPPGSLKARFCVEGNRRLYAYCAERGIEHRRCGKLVVAASAAQAAGLARLRRNAEACGVGGLRMLAGAEAMAMEPALRCHAALHSPDSGIIDTHALMLAYQGDAERAGAVVALGSPMAGGRVLADGVQVDVGGAEPMSLHARLLVNAASLHAQALARALEGFPPAQVPPCHYAKGNYFSVSGRSPFSRLIYPMPESAGLGVHLTLDLGGQARFGPDVEWTDSLDYDVDPRRADVFYEAIRSYWPALADGALQPAYAGIRPKIQGPGEAAADFLIAGPAEHGVPGVVHLFGIESPGLTASLAIADHVAAIAAG
ncbi:NAD(P)/FAD-dependent oxidoreductase [Pigmentiphaga soli]|uniref:NAD(P)/FAD-dependent oxidoreductase n=1 Tax=Pigmentiphaga soli TaxID=1007095 RepID=UPI0031EE31B2